MMESNDKRRSRGANMDVRLHRVLILGAILALGLGPGCAKERGLQPGPAKYYAYVSIWQSPSVVLMFDMDADTIVDSIVINDDRQSSILCDDRTSCCFIWHTEIVRKYCDAESSPSDQFMLLTGERGITHSPDYLVNSRGTHGGVYPPELRLYDLRDYEEVYSDTFALQFPSANSEGGLLFGLNPLSDEGHLTGSDFIAYDYVNRELHKIWKINPNSENHGYWLRDYAIGESGRYLYATAETPSSSVVLICYDLHDEKILFENPIYAPFGQPRLTPDCRELWYPDPGSGIVDPSDGPQTITVYNAESGDLLETISLDEYRVGGNAVHPRKIRFHPSGEKAYVMCGYGTLGPLLIIDVPSRKVIKAMWTGRESRAIYDLDVGPGTIK